MYERSRHPDAIETSAEVTISTFLRPFIPEAMLPDATHKITGAGYTSANALVALDERQLHTMGLSDSESARVLLASWLHAVGLAQYGGELVRHGCTSRIQLAKLNEEQLKDAGIAAIGHRRQLQRYLREGARAHATVMRPKSTACQLPSVRTAHPHRPAHPGSAHPGGRGKGWE